MDELSKLDDLEFDTEKECPYADRVMQEKRQRLRSTYFKILEYYKNTQKIDQWKGIGFAFIPDPGTPGPPVVGFAMFESHMRLSHSFGGGLEIPDVLGSKAWEHLKTDIRTSRRI